MRRIATNVDPIAKDSFPIRKLFTISHVLCLTGQPYTIKLFDRLRSIIIVLSIVTFVKIETKYLFYQNHIFISQKSSVYI